MPINVTVSDQTISATTSGQTVAVGVSGGQGPVGPPGTTTWSGITDKPATFAPSAHSHPISEVMGLQTALDAKQAAGSYATLDGSGKVPAAQLPSYVDDVLEVANLAALPATGETGKIYVTIDSGKTYRWSGSAYLEVSAAPASTDQVPEGATNLYHTTGRAAAAAPVQSVAGKTGTVTLAKADVGLGNVDNTADASKPVSTAQAAADAAVQAAAVQRANHTGTQEISTVSGLQTALDGKAAASHAHAAGDITSGTIATARLGSGTASSSTFLRGDQTYAAPVTSLNSATGAVTMPTVVEFTPTTTTATGATKTDFTGYAVWSWTIPSSAQYAFVELQGAGAGGGSGRRGAAGSSRGGGGGGGAGPFRRVVWRVADLPSRDLSIQLGAGGAGGAAVAADDTNGNPGSQPGAASNIQLNASPFPVLLRASSAGNGGGATTAGGSGGNGAQSSASDPFGGSPGGAGGVGAAGTAGTAAQCEASSGGGGGGGLDTGNTTRAGGAGGASVWIGQSAGGAAGTAGGGNGAAGATFGASICGTGGGGGGSATAAAGGNGGNGGRGAGGGGGGASTNGFASGAGGNGGDALCRIILF